jgi:outer membrane protein
MSMPSKLRAALALGLGLVGLAALVTPTSGQDGNQRTAAPRTPARPPAVVGCVDIQAVLKAYHKVEFLNSQLETEVKLKTAELNKMMAEYQELAKQIEAFQPNSADFKNLDDKMAKLSSTIQVEKERAQRDLQLRQAQAIATIYREIQQMVAAVAKQNGMTYVLQVSNEPITDDNPDAVLAATMRSVVYADPAAQTDMTQMVINYLNTQYDKAHPEAAAAAAAAPAPVDPNAAPASTRPAAGAGAAAPAPGAGAARPPAGNNAPPRR